MPSDSIDGAITPAKRLIKAQVKEGSDDDDDDTNGDGDDSEDDENKERVKSESYDILNVLIRC